MHGKVRPHDPFELIRWLAFSQPDPRKALAELVQNSLDAGARNVRLIRVRMRGIPCLRILDDGEGVIPEMDRRDALRYIATHIGHSRKRSLSPQQRLELMTQGQYGIGLLGFWSLGHQMEIRSSMPGQQAFRLILHRDSPRYEIEALRGRLPLDERRTEVVVSGVHREALPLLAGRRAADYLASELRGQILARTVDLVVEDRMSRGTSQKIVPVRPPRFYGERVPGLDWLDVPGHPPIRMEIYVRAEAPAADDSTGLALYSAGTLVAENFLSLTALELAVPPWTDGRLSGIIDFGGFRVAPGSRRGVTLDEAAIAFADALRTVEPILVAVLDRFAQQRTEEIDRAMVRDLQRVFRDFYRQQPRYAMLPVSEPGDQAAGPEPQTPGGQGPEPGGSNGDSIDTVEPNPDAAEGATQIDASLEIEQVPLLPPGPLQSVRITPQPFRVECRGTRKARAHALDGEGRMIEGAVEFAWQIEGPVGQLAPVDGRPAEIVLQAGGEPSAGLLTVIARAMGRVAQAEAPVEILDEIQAGRSDEGIPRPRFLHDPGGIWRSRLVEGGWEVNSGHREYVSMSESPALKLRYLAMLFAKEVVLRSHRDPRLERPLEQLVEVVAFADRNLTARRGGKRSAGRPPRSPDGESTAESETNPPELSP
jgi:hypothetical protein